MKKLALISVHNKEGITDFASELVNKYNYKILSTGGTAKLLRENGIEVTEVNELTKFPEMLEGRVKTLHPVIHAGLLARRDKPAHMQTIKDHNIEPIDIVVINLYPFEKTISKPDVSQEEAIENIDIGGPSIIRSAAKNYQAVAVISSPDDYKEVLSIMNENKGQTTLSLREKLAQKAFERTSKYDCAIAQYLSSQFKSQNINGHKKDFPETLDLSLGLKQVLRYGENPHQRAALYLTQNSSDGLANAEVIQGKELSFNNYLDLEAAWNIVCEFNKETPFSVIIKHNNPCGAAIAPNLYHAYVEAFNCDTLSAFGGIVGFNDIVDEKTAAEMSKIFLEAIIAPDYKKEALEILKAKPSLRVLKVKQSFNKNQLDIKKVDQGYLIQELNEMTLDLSKLKVVTKRQPTEQEMIDLVFAWKLCKHVKSNAIVAAKEGKSIGIGTGQTSRVASVEIALSQANYNAKDAVLASDAFFPFKDNIEIAASAKIAAIIQPGGSVKDQEVIETCDKYNIAMVFTGLRHFKH